MKNSARLLVVALAAFAVDCSRLPSEKLQTNTGNAGLAAAPLLGVAESFAVLGGSAITNIGSTLITGDLGISPGTAITGFPPGIIDGTTHATDALALQAQEDAGTAYDGLAAEACDTTFSVPTDIGGQTLVPGVYCFASSAHITGTLTLNAGGDPDAVWVFKVASTLTTATNAAVVLIGQAQACHVFWQVGSSATLGTSSTIAGSIIALTSITLTTNVSLTGRALARNGAVTMDAGVVSLPVCDAVPPLAVAPTLGKAFSPASIEAGGSSTLTITLSNADSGIANLSVPLTDLLPIGVVILGSVSTTCGGTLTADSASLTLTAASIPANGSCTVTALVSAELAGDYVNTLIAGALQTNNGINAAPAVATLTVRAAAIVVVPTLVKTFFPTTIKAGGLSTLTLTLRNANATDANLTAPLTDHLPDGVVVAGEAITTCGGTLSAVAGSSDVTLTGGAIAAAGFCTVIVDVIASCAGSYCNTIAPGALQTDKGANASATIATLTVL